MVDMKHCIILAIVCLNLLFGAGWGSDSPYRTVVDSRGVAVQLPAEINRVVTIDDGLIEGVMISLGVENKLIGVGSRTFKEIDNYTYPTVKGENYSYTGGMNTATFLNPSIKDLPLIAEYGAGVNFEALSSLKPDVVIINLGSCTFWTNDETVNKSLERIASLGIPVVVLYGTDFYEKPNISTLWDETRIIGQVFDKGDESNRLVDYLKNQVNIVDVRTKNISEDKKPSVLYFGLSPLARDEGSAGNTVSLKSFESWAIENLVHARNAFRVNSGYNHKVNTEQVLAINPDVIILPTDEGYHPVREIMEAPYYRSLQELDAVKDGRIVTLPWTPYDCAKRLEYPIEVMIIAKTVYPKLFEDINLGDWILDFYQNVYHVNRNTAKGLRSIQWLDWTVGNKLKIGDVSN